MSEPVTPFVQRVILRNYKSIRECDVSLGPLTLLVGPNGSGKSNFLDALRFVGDSLRTTMWQAVDARGEVRRLFWRGEACTEFSAELRMTLPESGDVSYDLKVGDEAGVSVVEEEHCLVGSREKPNAEFYVERGQVTKATIPEPPQASESQLYLTNVSGYPQFSEVYMFLKGMRFFNLDPQRIRDEASLGKPARELLRDGRGALSATHRAFRNQKIKERMQEYMQSVLPAFDEIRIETTLTDIGPRHGAYIKRGDYDELAGEPKSLKFLLRAGDTRLAFDAQNISDGTLRAFGVLLALFQCLERPRNDPIPLVGIEEPEAALHPAAAGVLFDALHEASDFTQVLVTTHSADLLDIKDIDPESLLIVDMVDGETVIGPADEASRSIMRDRLATAGELLRDQQLRPQTQPPGPVGAENVEG